MLIKWQRDDVNLKDYESVPPNTRFFQMQLRLGPQGITGHWNWNSSIFAIFGTFAQIFTFSKSNWDKAKMLPKGIAGH